MEHSYDVPLLIIKTKETKMQTYTQGNYSNHRINKSDVVIAVIAVILFAVVATMVVNQLTLPGSCLEFGGLFHKDLGSLACSTPH
jgi:hypothetical protein